MENVSHTDDPLLECLVIFTKMHGRPFSADSLVAGLPVEEGKSAPRLFSKDSSKALFSRAAAKAGFVSKTMRISLEEISPLTLPCILLLKGTHDDEYKACIMESMDDLRQNIKVIIPELGEVENVIDIDTLRKEYVGFAFFLKKEFRYEERDLKLIEDKDSHWFWGTMAKVRDVYRDVIIASLLINLFVLATPLFTMNVYDRVVPNNAIETLWVLALGVIVVYFIDITMKFIRSYFLEVAGKKSDIIMSSLIFERVMDLQMSSLPKSIGSFANILKEFESIRGFLTSSTISLLIDLPFIILFLITIYAIAGNLVLVPIFIIVVISLYTLLLKQRLHKSVKNTYSAASQKNGVLIESLSSIETLKTLGALGFVQWKWEEATGNIADKSIQTKFLSSSITTTTGFLVQLNTVLIIIAGVYMIAERELTMGGLIAAVIISSRTIAPMGQVASLLATYQHTRTAFQALENIMNLPVEHPRGKRFIQRPEYKGQIEFKNVTFSYPEAEKPSLSNVSFKINPGERVGLVGKIGSGKSTIQKLSLGLFYPESGSILVDGIDIKQLDPAELRKNFAYVSQDVVLFSGTVKENMIYRAPHADDGMILKAARISGVLDFVNKNPKGFDMSVGEKGARLSGGQRQSISIARAILLDSPVVILDEPSNSMDNASEKKLIENIDSYLEGKTTLLVTHKTSMLKLVDRLIVLEDGHIILDGPKEEVFQELKNRG